MFFIAILKRFMNQVRVLQFNLLLLFVVLNKRPPGGGGAFNRENMVL